MLSRIPSTLDYDTSLCITFVLIATFPLSPKVCAEGLVVNPAAIADPSGASGGLCDWEFNVTPKPCEHDRSGKLIIC